MRIVCTIDTQKTDENPYAFSQLLASQGIENECEELSSSEVRIWVHDEDAIAPATALYEEYRSNPHIQIEAPKEEPAPLTARAPKKRLLSPAPYGPISIGILLVVITLFMWAQIQRSAIISPKIPGIVQAPLLSPVERALIYDYPPYFEKRDQLFKIYPPKAIEEKQAPPAEALTLIQELRQHPPWMGIYDQIVLALRNGEDPLGARKEMFDKISSGEVWRLLTPILLHFDLLHIFFNVLWFILLGNQIEFRLGWLRYLILIIATGIISNTAQYLMSGPFFMGLSGVVCGMAAFIWARQQVAPWEGYLLHRFTLIFLAIFVLGMFLLQTVFFFLQIFGNLELTVGIANTAHLTGALVGYLLGRTRFFSINRNY